MISSVVNPALKQYEGKTVAEMAKAENKPEMDAFFDFILADKGQTDQRSTSWPMRTILQYGLKQAWTSIGLDAGETSLDGPLFEAAYPSPRVGRDAALPRSLLPAICNCLTWPRRFARSPHCRRSASILPAADC